MFEKHQLVLDFIKAYMKIHGVAPSYQVIANGLGLKSKSNIHRIVHALQEEKRLTLRPHKFNSIRILDKGAKEVLGL
jgi:SOS-response transcriptional repressor LexA